MSLVIYIVCSLESFQLLESPGNCGSPAVPLPPLFTGAFHQGLARLRCLRADSVKEEAQYTIEAVLNILDEERAFYAFNMDSRNL